MYQLKEAQHESVLKIYRKKKLTLHCCSEIYIFNLIFIFPPFFCLLSPAVFYIFLTMYVRT